MWKTISPGRRVGACVMLFLFIDLWALTIQNVSQIFSNFQDILNPFDKRNSTELIWGQCLVTPVAMASLFKTCFDL